LRLQLFHLNADMIMKLSFRVF